MKYIILFITIITLTSCLDSTTNTSKSANPIPIENTHFDSNKNINGKSIVTETGVINSELDLNVSENTNIINNLNPNENNSKFEFSDIKSVFKNIFTSNPDDNLDIILEKGNSVQENINDDKIDNKSEKNTDINDIINEDIANIDIIKSKEDILIDYINKDKVYIEDKKTENITNEKTNTGVIVIIKSVDEVIDTSILNDNKSVELGKPAVQK